MSWFRLKKGKRIIALTEEHDRIISQEIIAQIKKQKSFVNNPEKEAKLHNIAEKVTSTLHKKIEIKIYIVQDDTVNTGLPDGIVFINSGTLKNLKDDNMLACNRMPVFMSDYCSQHIVIFQIFQCS